MAAPSLTHLTSEDQTPVSVCGYET
jgi:hypothetical protein